MARIWSVYEGADEPGAEMSLDDAIRVLDLDLQYYLGELTHPPKPGDVGYRHVVVKVGEGEARAEWRSGFYRSPLSTAEAMFRLQVHQCLSDRWRDEWEKGSDADGDPALWLSAILKADAPEAEWARENRERIQVKVREAASQHGVSDWVFIRFRKEEERVTS